MNYIYGLLLVCISICAHNKDLFKQGSGHLEAGNYAQALALYKQIEPKNGAVWNNMAIAAYHLNDTLHAQLYWLRAQKNTSVSNTISHNLAFAKLTANTTMLECITHFCNPIFIQILFFCLFSVFLIFVVRYSKQKKYVSVSILSISCLMSGALTYQLYQQQKNSYGLVMADSAVYIGPDTLYHVADQIQSGTKVLIDDDHAEWKHIAWNNKKGWMPSKDLETI